MDYRPLGRTGVKVSSLCLGCMMFGARTNADDAATIVEHALDAGVNFLDTANVYGAGRSEEYTGEALKRSGRRQQVILATKVHGNMNESDPNARGNSRRHIVEQCEASLRRLQTDYIDLYQIHRPEPETAIDETLRALDDLVRSGKVRYLGTSTFGAWQLVESLWVSERLGLNRFICEQPPYNILDRRIERELVPMAQTYGFALIPWSPLAGGLLTGKYQRDERPPEDSRYSDVDRNPMRRDRLVPGVYDVVDQLQPFAQEAGATLAQYALAWCMNQPSITSAIIGPRTLEQLEDNLGALNVSVAPAAQERIDDLVPPGRMIAPFYEADFGPHPYRV